MARNQVDEHRNSRLNQISMPSDQSTQLDCGKNVSD